MYARSLEPASAPLLVPVPEASVPEASVAAVWTAGVAVGVVAGAPVGVGEGTWPELGAVEVAATVPAG